MNIEYNAASQCQTPSQFTPINYKLRKNPPPPPKKTGLPIIQTKPHILWLLTLACFQPLS